MHGPLLAVIVTVILTLRKDSVARNSESPHIYLPPPPKEGCDMLVKAELEKYYGAINKEIPMKFTFFSICVAGYALLQLYSSHECSDSR